MIQTRTTFYVLDHQILHKLLSLESFVQGGPPLVRCEGERRESIMRIREEATKVQHSKCALVPILVCTIRPLQIHLYIIIPILKG